MHVSIHQTRGDGRAQFLHRNGPSAGCGLVGGHVQAAGRVRAVLGRQRDGRDCGDAVRVGDGAAMPGQRARIHFRHRQRHDRVRAEDGGVVRHDRASRTAMGARSRLSAR